ncbi:MAG: glycosyltransferase [Bacteroidales bacterium]
MKKRANVLFVTIDGGGNLPPVLGLASEMSKSGYQVSVLSEPCMEEVIRDQGFQFIPFQKHFTRNDRKEDIFGDWNTSPIKNPVLEKIVFGPVKIVTDETLEAIQHTHADLVVADCLLPTALIAAEAGSIPGILAFHMPEYFPGANRPPGMFGLKPGKGTAGRFRDKILTRLFNLKLNQFLPAINQTRKRLGLPLLGQTSDLVHRADLRLIQTLERFDFPLEPRPANVRYTGPVLNDPDWTTSWTYPWDEEDPRPLVVISLSSTFQNQHGVIQSTIDALRDQEVRGLVTLGPALEKDRFAVPENVVIVDSAPHSQVFPKAHLVITHAGHGTVMRALSHGLPLICLPMGRDQNDNAVKVQHYGCGIALTAKAGPEKIRKAVQEVLGKEGYKQAAASFREEIRASGQTMEVIREIGDLLAPANKGTVKPVEASLRYA